MELRGVGRDRQGGLCSAFCIQNVHLLLGNRTLNGDLIVLQDAVGCTDLIGGAINNTVVDRIDTIELRPAVSDNILKVGIEACGLIQLHKQVALDLVFFLTQLSTYIKSGIPLTDSIVMLDEQTKNKNRKNLYKKILYELNTGAPFSEALARQGNIFPKLLINMLKTSELTGNLTEALDDMAAYYKTADTNRKQIISALTYPSVVLVVAIAVLTFLLIFIIPRFEDIFKQLGADLPGITVFLVNTSNFVKDNIIKILIAVAGVIIILIAMYKNIKKFRYFVQYILMHIPIIKNVIIDNQIVMFTKTFSSLIRHDVFITDSIEMLGKVTNNEIYKDIIKEAVTNLSTGAGLSKAFEDKWAFPRIAYEMLVTGEKTGRLGVMMENVASYYEEEQKALIQRLKSLIEPVMIILLAGIVGVVLLAIFVPMFSMYNDIL